MSLENHESLIKLSCVCALKISYSQATRSKVISRWYIVLTKYELPLSNKGFISLGSTENTFVAFRPKTELSKW